MPARTWNLRRLRSESGYWRAPVLLTAAHLDLFSWIDGKKKTPGALAAHFGGRSASWEIFLDALCALGLLRKERRSYANTAFSRRSLGRGGAASLLCPDFDVWRPWGRLAAALTAGKRPRAQEPFFSHRRQTARLLHALDLDAQKIAPHLMRRVPLGGATTLLDVGGGLGSFAIAFCRRYPRLSVTLLEHPKVLPLARRAVTEACLAERVRLVGLDFTRDVLPEGFDVAFVSNVLHAQGARENRRLLAKLHRSLNSDGQLILRDVFMNPARTAPAWGALFSVLLLLHTPAGRCYSLDEIRRWLEDAGFAPIKGPFRSSPLFFDPDSVLIAEKR